MRTWEPADAPADVGLVRDSEGDLWQRCRERNWEMVYEYQKAGLPKVGEMSWWALLGEYGPLTEVEVPE